MAKIPVEAILESLAAALNAMPDVFSTPQWGGRAYKLPGPGSRGTKKPVIQINYVGQRANVRDLPAFVRLADSLDVRIIHFVHLLVSAEVKESESLVHHPEALTIHVREAEKIARQLGVQLYVSPSYTAVIAEFERGVRAG